MQAVMIASGSGFSLLPPGLVLLGALSLPGIAIARIVSALRRNFGPSC